MPARRRRWWLRALLALLCASGAAFAVWLAVSGGWGDRAIASARKETIAKGYATSLEELYARRKPVDDEANAALVYEEAAIAFETAGGEESATPDAPYGRCVPLVSHGWLTMRRPPDAQVAQAQKDVKQMELDPRTPMPDYILAASKYYVDKRSEAVALIGKARELPEACYANAFLTAKAHADDPSRYTNTLRRFRRLIALAAWVDAEEGRPAAAIAKLRDNLAMAASLADEPFIVSSYIYMAIGSLTTKETLPRVLARTNPSNADFVALQGDFARLAAKLSLKSALQGEIARVLGQCNRVESGKTPIRDAYRPSAYLRLSYDSPMAAWADRNLPAITSGFYKRDVAMLVRYYLWALDHIDDGPAVFADIPDPLLAEIKAGRYIMARNETHDVPLAVIQAALTTGTLEAAAAALAACRYRNDHNTWPESLDALVPAYMDKVPLDPFTGKPLVYKIEEAGIAVYSVGANGVDDGGKGFLPGSDATQGDDNGMRVWK